MNNIAKELEAIIPTIYVLTTPKGDVHHASRNHDRVENVWTNLEEDRGRSLEYSIEEHSLAYLWSALCNRESMPAETAKEILMAASEEDDVDYSYERTAYILWVGDEFVGAGWSRFDAWDNAVASARAQYAADCMPAHGEIYVESVVEKSDTEDDLYDLMARQSPDIAALIRAHLCLPISDGAE